MAKACRQRLQVLFGPTQPTRRRFHKRERRHNWETVVEYVKEAERIGGKGLLRGRRKLPIYLMRKEGTETVVDRR